MNNSTNRRAALRSWAGRLVQRTGAAADGTTEPISERDAILASELFDLEWYSSEAGQEFATVDDALTHYLSVGYTHRYSPNPLLDNVPERFDSKPLTPMGRFVAGDDLTLPSTHPAWSAQRYRKAHPESADHPFGALGHLYANYGPDMTFDLRGPDGPVTVRWADVEPHWRDLSSMWSRERRRLIPGWADELPEDHGTPSFPADMADPDVTVSIVIATWNRAASLRTALDSVVAQTWQRWEALVVDDGSDDETAVLVQAMAAGDPRIRLIQRPHEGVCAARNQGIAAATGEFIAFLDSDNTWQPEFLHHMVCTMQDSGIDAAYATLETETPDGPRYRAQQVNRDILLATSHVDLNVLVVRATTLQEVGGFDPSLLRTVDYDLVLRLTAVTDLVHVPVIGVHYDNNEHDDRISLQHPATWADAVRLKNLINWNDLTAAPRDLELVSIVIPAGQRPKDTLARVKIVREELGSQPWEIVVADDTVSRRTLNTLLPTLLLDSRVRYLRISHPHTFAFTADMGFSATRGGHVLFLDFDVEPDPGTVTSMVEQARAMVGSYLLEPAQPADGPAGRTFMIRANDFCTLRGLQPLLHNEYEVADLRLRLRAVNSAATFERLDDATVTRRSTSRDPQRHEANVRLFVDLHGTEPTQDGHRS